MLLRNLVPSIEARLGLECSARTNEATDGLHELVHKQRLPPWPDYKRERSLRIHLKNLIAGNNSWWA
jgi:hypothetical protein